MNYCGINYTFMPLITSFCGDMPATSEVQSMKEHSGYFACRFCLHEGDLIKRANSKSVVRYVRRDGVSMRTHSDMLQIYRKLKSPPVNGVKAISCMVAANNFDLVNGFSVDYMHCALLGVMKKLMALWLNSKNHKEPFFISKKRQVELSKRIVCIKPLIEITRKPRSIYERKDYKANEYRTLLLYYLRYCLVDLLPMRYINHFQLFSSAVYILLKEHVSNENITTAEAMLLKFADKFEDLYGKHNVTMNLHLIRHMANSVRHLGPLWAQSTFAFETNNGVLMKSSSAKNDSWRYLMKSSLCDDEVNESVNAFVNGKTIIRLNSCDVSHLREFGVETNGQLIEIYRSIFFKGRQITSMRSKIVSTIDYFVEIDNGEIGCVDFYLLNGSMAFAFIHFYAVIDRIDHLFQIEAKDEKRIVAVERIRRKMIFMKIKQNVIVSAIPNRFEKT